MTVSILSPQGDNVPVTVLQVLRLEASGIVGDSMWSYSINGAAFQNISSGAERYWTTPAQIENSDGSNATADRITLKIATELSGTAQLTLLLVAAPPAWPDLRTTPPQAISADPVRLSPSGCIDPWSKLLASPYPQVSAVTEDRNLGPAIDPSVIGRHPSAGLRVESDGKLRLGASCGKVPGRGITTGAAWHYTSAYFDFGIYDGPFGKGGTHDTYRRLLKDASDNFVVVTADGSRIPWFTDGSSTTYYAAGQFGSFQDLGDAYLETTPNAIYYSYDYATGKVFRARDANGNEQYYHYDGSGDLTFIAGSRAVNVYFEYNANRATALRFRDPADASSNRVTTFDYYPAPLAGYLQKITGPDGCVTYLVYDANKNIERVVDPDNYTTYIAYDGYGRVKHVQNPLGDTTYYAFDDTAARTVSRDPLGAVTYLFYEPNRAPRIAQDALGSVAYYQFDADRLPTWFRDPTQAWNYYQHDADGNQSVFVNGAGEATYYGHDTARRLTAAEDPLHRTSYYHYDADGNLLKASDPTGATTYLAYDTYGQVTTLRDALARATYFDYNAYGNQVYVRDALNNAAYFAYDPFGNVVTREDALLRSNYFTYDQDDRLLTEKDAAGNTASLLRDNRGLVIRSVDRRNQTTYFDHDGLGNLVAEVNPLAQITYVTVQVPA